MIYMDKLFFREIVAIIWYQQCVKAQKYLLYLTLTSNWVVPLKTET